MPRPRTRWERRASGGDVGLLAAEMVLALAIVAVLWGLQASIVVPLIEQSRAAQVLGTHGAKARVDLAVHFALHGRFPDGDPTASGMPQWTQPAPDPRAPDRRGTPLQAFDHGAVTYPYGPAASGPARVLTVRPWAPRGEPPATIGWVCGHAPPPVPDAVVFGRDATTVAPRDLPAFCRGARS